MTTVRVLQQCGLHQGLMPAARERLLLLALSSLETVLEAALERATPSTTGASEVLADAAAATCNAWHGTPLPELDEARLDHASAVVGTCWQAAAEKLQLYEDTLLTFFASSPSPSVSRSASSTSTLTSTLSTSTAAALSLHRDAAGAEEGPVVQPLPPRVRKSVHIAPMPRYGACVVSRSIYGHAPMGCHVRAV